MPAALLLRLLAEAADVPHSVVMSPPLPTFYNFFPAGYHFFVAEALFLTSQFEALHGWLEFTRAEFPELATLEPNVYNEVLRGFAAVARLRTGRAADLSRSAHLPIMLETHSWLLDYYQVHLALVELHIITLVGEAAQAAQLLARVAAFARAHQFPFFNQIVQRIA